MNQSSNLEESLINSVLFELYEKYEWPNVRDKTEEELIRESVGKNILYKHMPNILLAPSSNTDVGNIGDIRYDKDYMYICIAENNWVRREKNEF
jgi:hypothetical protein